MRQRRCGRRRPLRRAAAAGLALLLVASLAGAARAGFVSPLTDGPAAPGAGLEADPWASRPSANAAAAAAAAAAVAVAAAAAAAASPPAEARAAAGAYAEVAAAAAAGRGPVEVIVAFRVEGDGNGGGGGQPYVAARAGGGGGGGGNEAAARGARVGAHAAAKRRALDAAIAAAGGGAGRASTAGGARVALTRELPQLPLAVVSVDGPEALAALEAAPGVLYVAPSRARVRPAGLPLPSASFVWQPEAAGMGFTGQNCSVAVLDTGVNYLLPDFGPCTAVGQPAGVCRVAYSADFAPNDNSLDDNGHGTNVASIISKIAPGSLILMLDVFDLNMEGQDMDILAAIDWVIANKDAYNICSINMSFGGADPNYAPCPEEPTATLPADVFAKAIREARDAGIPSAVASGNSRFTNALATPACAPASVSVGAVYDPTATTPIFSCDSPVWPDRVACFSNSAPFLDLLAPGLYITAGGITMSGTSQATPHVAGALAVLRAAAPNATVDDLVAALQATGVPVPDARNGVVTPRINVAAAAARIANVPLRPVDHAPPVAFLLANGGQPYSSSPNVTFLAIARDFSGCRKMCVSEGPACGPQGFGPLVPYDSSFQTSPGDGPKTLNLWLRDVAGNAMASPATASFTVDTTPPSNVSVSINGGAPAVQSISVTLQLQATDLTPMTMCVYNPGQTCVFSVNFSPTLAFTLSGGGGEGRRTVYFRAKDAAGNVSPVASATTVYDITPPRNASVLLAGGLPWAGPGPVALQVAAADASGVAAVCVSDSPGPCSAFVPYNGTLMWLPPKGPGRKTVYVTLRDAAGNAMTSPASASIIIDNAPPANASVRVVVSAAGGGATTSGGVTTSPFVDLAVTGSDDVSGVAAMCVSNNASSSPCAPFVPFLPYVTGWRLADPGGEGLRGVFVWLRDGAGNAITSPAAAWVYLYRADGSQAGGQRPASSDGAGLLLIDGGRPWARGVDVNVTIWPPAGAANDSAGAGAGGGGAAACLANGAPPAVDAAAGACAGVLVPLGAGPDPVEVPWRLEPGAGVKAVFATLLLFNTSDGGAVGGGGGGGAAPLVDTIALDNTPPTALRVALNGGALWAAGRDVTLSVAATDDVSGVAGVCVADGGAADGGGGGNGTDAGAGGCQPFVPFNATSLWRLSDAPPPGGGCRRTVYVTLRDAAGNAMTSPALATIGLDADPPFYANVTINGGAALTKLQNVALSVSGADACSGVAAMCVSNDGSAPCAPFVPFTGVVLWTLPTGAADGPRTVYVTLRDRVGNAMASPVTATIVLDAFPPANASLVVNGGAPATAAPNVTLQLAASDGAGSGVAEMCVSQASPPPSSPAACRPWLPFSPTLQLLLADARTQGPRTLSAFFRDAAGRATPQPAVASIRFDTIPPTMPPAAATLGLRVASRTASEVGVAWDPAASSDPGGSGVAGYLLAARRGGGAPALYCTGALSPPGVAVVAVGAGAGATSVGNLMAAGTYTLRLCAVDAAGNRAKGVVVKVGRAAKLAP